MLHLPSPLQPSLKDILHQGVLLYLKTTTVRNNQESGKISLVPKHSVVLLTQKPDGETDEYIENNHILQLEKDVIQGPRAPLDALP